MDILRNPWRGIGLTIDGVPEVPISTDVTAVRALLQHCPIAEETPLLRDAPIEAACAVDTLWLKDERCRMGLGSFKATGAAYVIANDAQQALNQQGKNWDDLGTEQRQQLLAGTTYVCSSAGNHGLSIAAGARVFGAQSNIYLSHSVPESFAERLRALGSGVVRAGDDYEASLEAAKIEADTSDAQLLSDSSWPGYMATARKLMEGYTIVGSEIVEQLAGQQPPSHILLQAGVGGIAAAATAMFRQHWGDDICIVVVEPEAAPALYQSIQAGKAVVSQGPVSNMGRLDCKEPSLLALAELSRNADWFVTLSDDMVQSTVTALAGLGLDSTPSGLAGVAVLQPGATHADAAQKLRQELAIHNQSRVLAIVTEQVD